MVKLIVTYLYQGQPNQYTNGQSPVDSLEDAMSHPNIANYVTSLNAERGLNIQTGQAVIEVDPSEVDNYIEILGAEVVDEQLIQGRKTLHWAGVAAPATDTEILALLRVMGWVWVSKAGVWDKAEYRPEFHQFSEF